MHGPNVDDSSVMRDVIDFDSEAADGQRQLAAVAPKAANGLSKFVEIPWPAKLAPVPGKAPTGPEDAALPKCDVLVVTWTVDEGHALSRVLTSGFDSRDDWKRYTKNYAEIAKHMVPTRRRGSTVHGSWAPTGPPLSAIARSRCSSRTRTCPKTAPTFPTPLCGARSSKTVTPNWSLPPGPEAGSALASRSAT